MFSALLLCQESKDLLLFLMAFDFSSSTRNCRSGGCKLPNTSLAVFPLKLPSSTSKGLLPSPVGHSVSPSSQYLSRLLQSSPFLHLSPCIFVFPGLSIPILSTLALQPGKLFQLFAAIAPLLRPALGHPQGSQQRAKQREMEE